MRQTCVVLMIALSVAAAGREASAETVVAGSTARPLTRAFDEAIKRESSFQMTRYPGPHRSPRCCSLKGALIGAAAGAGIGLALSRSAPDMPTVAITASFGGIGAGVGIFM